jgi:hypothetical protein
MGTKMNTIDDGYYFAPYLPIGVVPTIGNISKIRDMRKYTITSDTMLMNNYTIFRKDIEKDYAKQL